MNRFFGIFGIIGIFLLAYALSNNRKAINYKTVGMGFLLQVTAAIFIFKNRRTDKLNRKNIAEIIRIHQRTEHHRAAFFCKIKDMLNKVSYRKENLLSERNFKYKNRSRNLQ